MVKIYHNPRCSKSRQALQLLHDNNQEARVIEYLKEIPSASELAKVIELLKIAPIDLIRKNEDDFKPFKGKSLSDKAYIDLMIAHPKLIERPIVVNGSKAVIGRPPEKVLDIL
jgi:arsenate reductase (glutaredoxin)